MASGDLDSTNFISFDSNDSFSNLDYVGGVSIGSDASFKLQDDQTFSNLITNIEQFSDESPSYVPVMEDFASDVESFSFYDHHNQQLDQLQTLHETDRLKPNTVLTNIDSHSDARIGADRPYRDANLGSWVNSALLSYPQIDAFVWRQPIDNKLDSSTQYLEGDYPALSKAYVDTQQDRISWNEKPGDYADNPERYREISVYIMNVDDPLPEEIEGRPHFVSIDLDALNNTGNPTDSGLGAGPDETFYEGEHEVSALLKPYLNEHVYGVGVSLSPNYTGEEFRPTANRIAAHLDVAVSKNRIFNDAPVAEMFASHELIYSRFPQESPQSGERTLMANNKEAQLTARLQRNDRLTSEPDGKVLLTNTTDPERNAAVDVTKQIFTVDEAQAKSILANLDVKDGRADAVIAPDQLRQQQQLRHQALLSGEQSAQLDSIFFGRTLDPNFPVKSLGSMSLVVGGQSLNIDYEVGNGKRELRGLPNLANAEEAGKIKFRPDGTVAEGPNLDKRGLQSIIAEGFSLLSENRGEVSSGFPQAVDTSLLELILTDITQAAEPQKLEDVQFPVTWQNEQGDKISAWLGENKEKSMYILVEDDEGISKSYDIDDGYLTPRKNADGTVTSGIDLLGELEASWERQQ